MFGLTTKKHADRVARTIALTTVAWQRKHADLLAEWNALIARINALGGENFLRGDVPHPNLKVQHEFSQEEIERLIRLCHPDKHNGSEAAKAMTQKLLSMRR